MVARIQQIPQFKRSSIRRLGHLSNVPKSTLQRCLKRFNAKLERVWKLLHRIMSYVIENEGGNDFSVPHAGARGAERSQEVGDASPISLRNLTNARKIFGDEAAALPIGFIRYRGRS